MLSILIYETVPRRAAAARAAPTLKFSALEI
jgi:hypothetical protein